MLAFFRNGKSSVLAVFLAILSTLFYSEVEDPAAFKLQETGVYTQRAKFLFDYLTDSHRIPEYFTTVKAFVEAKPNEALDIGKDYVVTISLPFVGLKDLSLTVKNYVPRKEVIYVTKDCSKKWLCPVFKLKVSSMKSDQAKITFFLHFENKSALFQYTLGGLLRLFLSQHLKHTLFTLHWILPPPEFDLEDVKE